jgi:hypothetical protein
MTDEDKQLKEFNDKWDMHKVISEAIANAHTTPAPETLKNFSEIRTILAVQNEKHASIDATLQEIKVMVGNTFNKVETVDDKVGIQNGRVRKLEDWANETKLMLEKLIKDDRDMDKDVSVSKAKIWTAITVLMLLGGGIITLAVMAIDSKIEKGIKQALENNVAKVEYEK